VADRWRQSSTSASKGRSSSERDRHLARKCLGGFEDLVEVPLQEIALRPVRPVFGKVDDLPCPGVELITVAKVFAQPRTDEKAVAGVDADVSAVEEGPSSRASSRMSLA
jgi:hypothetical protein